MAEIATYMCSNNQCRLTVRLSRDFPVWHPDTAPEIRTLAVTPAHQPYIARFRSELFCHHCRKVIVDAQTADCIHCGATDLRKEPAGSPCAQCSRGTLVMKHLSVH